MSSGFHSRLGMRLISVVLVSLLAVGCGPSLRRMDYLEGEHAPRGAGCDVVFKREVRIKPEKGTVIGTMRVRDTGFSVRCHEDEVLAILREEACRIGADVVVLRDIRPPDVLSTCYRVTADFVRLTDSTAVAGVESDREYSPDRVQRRVQQGKAMQVALGVIGGVVGFVLGFVIMSNR